MLESSAERRRAVVSGKDGHVTEVFMAGAQVLRNGTVEGGAGGGLKPCAKLSELLELIRFPIDSIIQIILP
jgi:hypothetical protein